MALLPLFLLIFSLFLLIFTLLIYHSITPSHNSESVIFIDNQALFRQKLQQCCIIFEFDDGDLDARGREIKRETLVEMAEYVNTPVGQKIFTESMMPDIVEMVKINLFRTLPPQADDFDPEEDEPAMEPSWPHLQVVYEFFLRFIVSTEVNGKVAKKYVDQSFIRMWIELFDAEDPRERDYVKTVLHRSVLVLIHCILVVLLLLVVLVVVVVGEKVGRWRKRRRNYGGKGGSSSSSKR